MKPSDVQPGAVLLAKHRKRRTRYEVLAVDGLHVTMRYRGVQGEPFVLRMEHVLAHFEKEGGK